MQNRTAYVTDPVLTTTDMQNLQTELATVITAFGGTLSGADLTQVSKFISDAIAASTQYTDSGAADAYVLVSPAGMRGISQYKTNALIRFRPAFTNTGASTVDVSSFGAKSIKKEDGSTALTAGDISADYDCWLIYDGTNFRLFSLGNLIAGILTTDIIQTKTASGDLILKNQAGDTMLTLNDNKSQNLGIVYSASLTALTTVDFVFANATKCDIIIAASSSGNVDTETEKILISSSAVDSQMDAYANAQDLNRFTFAYVSSSGSPNFQHTYRLTLVNFASDIRISINFNTGGLVSIT